MARTALTLNPKITMTGATLKGKTVKNPIKKPADKLKPAVKTSELPGRELVPGGPQPINSPYATTGPGMGDMRPPTTNPLTGNDPTMEKPNKTAKEKKVKPVNPLKTPGMPNPVEGMESAIRGRGVEVPWYKLGEDDPIFQANMRALAKLQRKDIRTTERIEARKERKETAALGTAATTSAALGTDATTATTQPAKAPVDNTKDTNKAEKVVDLGGKVKNKLGATKATKNRITANKRDKAEKPTALGANLGMGNTADTADTATTTADTNTPAATKAKAKVTTKTKAAGNTATGNNKSTATGNNKANTKEDTNKKKGPKSSAFPERLEKKNRKLLQRVRRMSKRSLPPAPPAPMAPYRYEGSKGSLPSAAMIATQRREGIQGTMTR